MKLIQLKSNNVCESSVVIEISIMLSIVKTLKADGPATEY